MYTRRKYDHVYFLSLQMLAALPHAGEKSGLQKVSLWMSFIFSVLESLQLSGITAQILFMA